MVVLGLLEDLYLVGTLVGWRGITWVIGGLSPEFRGLRREVLGDRFDPLMTQVFPSIQTARLHLCGRRTGQRVWWFLTNLHHQSLRNALGRRLSNQITRFLAQTLGQYRNSARINICILYGLFVKGSNLLHLLHVLIGVHDRGQKLIEFGVCWWQIIGLILGLILRHHVGLALPTLAT